MILKISTKLNPDACPCQSGLEQLELNNPSSTVRTGKIVILMVFYPEHLSVLSNNRLCPEHLCAFFVGTFVYLLPA